MHTFFHPSLLGVMNCFQEHVRLCIMPDYISRTEFSNSFAGVPAVESANHSSLLNNGKSKAVLIDSPCFHLKLL